MSLVSEDIAKSLYVSNQQPLDAKTFFNTLAELKDLGDSSNKAFSYYEGMEAYVRENNTKYVWKEISFGENGALNQSFAYPPNTIHDNVDYSGRYFNFIETSSNSSQQSSRLFFYEPSVNIEIKENITPTAAMYFGTLDLGAGIVPAALVKNTFVSQSNFALLDNLNVGAEIKIANGTNGNYLGHFSISDITFNGYRVLNIIEAGDWSFSADYDIQEVYINVLKPSEYELEIAGTNLIFTKGTQLLTNVDLAGLFGGGASTIVGISLDDNTGIVTFLFADTSTISVDFSGIIQADSLLSKEGSFPVIGSDIYENLFVAKTVSGHIGKGFYSADVTTDYTSASLPGFPYPLDIDFVMVKYNSRYYLLVKKTLAVGKRIFDKPNDVFGMSFFSYKDNTKKSMKKLAYLKVLSRKIPLAGLNNNYWAFKIWGNAGTQFPLATTTTAFNENNFYQGVNEKEAYCMISKIYEEKISLKKIVTTPYTIKEEDNGLILCINANGNQAITVPLLPFGFECGLVQFSFGNNIPIIGASGVQILKPASKSNVLLEQYASAYLMCNDQLNENSSVVNATTSNSFILLGDLKLI